MSYLKQLHIQNRLTQNELAAKLYITRATVSKWEHGTAYPTIEQLLDLSTVLNVDVDKLAKEIYGF